MNELDDFHIRKMGRGVIKEDMDREENTNTMHTQQQTRAEPSQQQDGAKSTTGAEDARLAGKTVSQVDRTSDVRKRGKRFSRTPHVFPWRGSSSLRSAC